METTLVDRYADSRENYGWWVGILVTIVFHGVALGGMYYASSAQEHIRPPMDAMRVKLGGPPKLELSGKSRKAPVAGSRKPKPKPTPVVKKPVTKPPPKKTATKKKKDQIGLNTKKKPPKKPEKKPEAVAEKATKGATPAPSVPEPKPDRRDNRAIGGLDGSDGSGVGVEVGDGSKEITEDDLEFISYFKTIQAEIAKRWTRSGFTSGTTRIRFHVHRDGSVTDVEVAKSSGRSYLDGPAKRAVMGAAFPPLPQGYLGEKLIVNINFQYGGQKK